MQSIILQKDNANSCTLSCENVANSVLRMYSKDDVPTLRDVQLAEETINTRDILHRVLSSEERSVSYSLKVQSFLLKLDFLLHIDADGRAESSTHPWNCGFNRRVDMDCNRDLITDSCRKHEKLSEKPASCNYTDNVPSVTDEFLPEYRRDVRTKKKMTAVGAVDVTVLSKKYGKTVFRPQLQESPKTPAFETTEGSGGGSIVDVEIQTSHQREAIPTLKSLGKIYKKTSTLNGDPPHSDTDPLLVYAPKKSQTFWNANKTVLHVDKAVVEPEESNADQKGPETKNALKSSSATARCTTSCRPSSENLISRQGWYRSFENIIGSSRTECDSETITTIDRNDFYHESERDSSEIYLSSSIVPQNQESIQMLQIVFCTEMTEKCDAFCAVLDALSNCVTDFTSNFLRFTNLVQSIEQRETNQHILDVQDKDFLHENTAKILSDLSKRVGLKENSKASTFKKLHPGFLSQESSLDESADLPSKVCTNFQCFSLTTDKNRSFKKYLRTILIAEKAGTAYQGLVSTINLCSQTSEAVLSLLNYGLKVLQIPGIEEQLENIENKVQDVEEMNQDAFKFKKLISYLAHPDNKM